MRETTSGPCRVTVTTTVVCVSFGHYVDGMIPIMTDRGSHCKHQRGERKKMNKNCVFVHCQWRVLCTAVIGPCIRVLAPGVYGSPPLQLRSPPSLCLLHLFSFPHLFPLWPRSQIVRIQALKACVRVRVCKTETE